MHRTLRGVICLSALALLLAGTPPRLRVSMPVEAAVRATVDWPHFGNSTDQTRFSSLSQISRQTVRQLGVAWTFRQDPHLQLWETDPVVVQGVMYLTTGTDEVIALNAATGAVRWTYAPPVDFSALLAAGGTETPVNRGVEVANGRVYLLTFDGQLFNLEAATGKPLWHVRVADPRAGYSENAPPTYWHGLLFVGSSGGDTGARGFVAAYAAATGRQVWRFYTVPPPGRSWMPARGPRGGGGAWMPPTIDTTTGILYLGTGNANLDLLHGRPGCRPWVDATLALNARTGRLLWGKTQVCPDLWDYDAVQTPLLFTLRRHGQSLRVVSGGNKAGTYWFFDAATGRVLGKSPALARQIVKQTTHTLVCPGKFGALTFSPPAFSPRTTRVFVPGVEMCMVYKNSPGGGIGMDAGVPAPGRATGFLAALDAPTGKIVWRTRVPGPMIGGALATDGGLIFSGADDGHFYAFDAGTGAILWQVNLRLAFGAAPISYAIDGVQYVAIAAGGSEVAVTTGAPTGGTLTVFRLHGKPITAGA